MKLALNFRSPLFDQPAVKSRLSRAIKEGALELESDIKRNIQSSSPSGRTYRRGAITKAESKNTKALNLKTFVTSSGKTRAIVGYKFHRASRIGQPPATDTGGLIGSIASTDLGELKSRVSVGRKYGQYLDDESGRLKRFFFRRRVIKYSVKFREKLLAALNG